MRRYDTAIFAAALGLMALQPRRRLVEEPPALPAPPEPVRPLTRQQRRKAERRAAKAAGGDDGR